MKRLNYHLLQDPARLIYQAYVSRVHNRRASSAFITAHRRASSNRVLDVAYASAEGDHALATRMSRRDRCYFCLVSCKSGTVTLVSHTNPTTATRHVSNVSPLLTFPPADPRGRVVKQVDANVGSDTRRYRGQLNTTGDLPQEQSCKFEPASSLSRATTLVYCVLPRITCAGDRSCCCRVYYRQEMGTITRGCARR